MHPRKHLTTNYLGYDFDASVSHRQNSCLHFQQNPQTNEWRNIKAASQQEGQQKASDGVNMETETGGGLTSDSTPGLMRESEGSRYPRREQPRWWQLKLNVLIKQFQ